MIKGKKNIVSLLILAIIVILQIVFFAVTAAAQKTALHEDEYFSYGLSNSYYRPFLYGSTLKVPDNSNIWMTGNDFSEYIKTNDDTAFSYGSVWHNQAEDTHPPLYYAFLHTICSVFKNTFSIWYGLILNLVCFAICQFFLYKLFRLLTNSDVVSLAVCFLYGFSIGGQNTVFFIRMYMMLTMWSVIFVYLNVRLYKKVDISFVSDIIPLALVTLAGALTQHLFLFFAFVYTALMCIYWLLKKKIKVLFLYGSSILAGVLLSFAVFPASIKHLFGGQVSWIGEPDPINQIYLFWRLLLAEISGYSISYYKSGNYSIILCMVFGLLIILALLSFLFRKDNWFIKIQKRVVHSVKAIPQKIKSLDYSFIFIFLSSVSMIIFTAFTVFYFEIGDDCDRYIFSVMPFLYGIALVLVYYVARLLTKKRVGISLSFAVIVALSVSVTSNTISSSRYLIDAKPLNNVKINQVVEDADVILVISSSMYLPAYCTMFETANDVFVTSYMNDAYTFFESEYAKIDNSDRPIYIVMDTNKVSIDDEYGIESSIDFDNMIGNEEFMDYMKQAYENKLQTVDIMDYFAKFYNTDYEFITSEVSHFCTLRVYKIL